MQLLPNIVDNATPPNFTADIRPPEEVIEASDKQAEVAPHIQDDFNDIDEDELKEAASKAGMTAFHVFPFFPESTSLSQATPINPRQMRTLLPHCPAC